MQCLGQVCALRKGHASYPLYDSEHIKRVIPSVSKGMLPAITGADAWRLRIQLLCRWHRQGGGHSPGQPGGQPLAPRPLAHSLSS